MLRSKGTPGVYSTGETVRQLPLDSHPIHHTKIGEDVSTRSSDKINTKSSSGVKPPGLINEEIIGRNAQQVAIGSDGSVYIKENRLGCMGDTRRCTKRHDSLFLDEKHIINYILQSRIRKSTMLNQAHQVMWNRIHGSGAVVQ